MVAANFCSSVKNASSIITRSFQCSSSASGGCLRLKPLWYSESLISSSSEESRLVLGAAGAAGDVSGTSSSSDEPGTGLRERSLDLERSLGWSLEPEGSSSGGASSQGSSSYHLILGLGFGSDLGLDLIFVFLTICSH